MLSDKMEGLWNKFSEEEKEAIDARYKKLHAQYMTLQEIRKHKKVTQEDMAKLLGIKQENVSRMERREDMHLSTLKEYIEALGGEMKISAIFPDNNTISIINGQSESHTY